MFDALSARLEKVSQSLRSRGRLTEADLDSALAEVRTALLEADVELSVVRAFLDAVRVRIAGENVATSEVAACLQQVPGVLEASVYGVKAGQDEGRARVRAFPCGTPSPPHGARRSGEIPSPSGGQEA
jgi:signal recognition particle subunit SRP54